ncbi:hypothetical protein [Longispora urticae]
MIKKIFAAALLGVASLTVVGTAQASAGGDCYTAVTHDFGFQLESSGDSAVTGTLYGSTHCNDVNVRRTSSYTAKACVIRVYQGQTDCNPTTQLSTGWQVPSGGSGIPNGSAFKVKFAYPNSYFKVITGTIAY